MCFLCNFISDNFSAEKQCSEQDKPVIDRVNEIQQKIHVFQKNQKDKRYDLKENVKHEKRCNQRFFMLGNQADHRENGSRCNQNRRKNITQKPCARGNPLQRQQERDDAHKLKKYFLERASAAHNGVHDQNPHIQHRHKYDGRPQHVFIGKIIDNETHYRNANAQI